MDEPDLNKCEELADKGFECLGNREYTEALDIARQLEELRYTAAFDIAAQAHAGQGDLEQAVAVLKRGLEKAPDCWVNCELLGNYLSDLQRYEEAERVYERALHCPEVDEDRIHLNQAIIAHRQGDHDKVLRLISSIQGDNPHFSLRAKELEVDVMWHLGHVDEAIALANHILGGPWEEVDGPAMARVAAALGYMQMERGESKSELRRRAVHALSFDEHCSDLLALIRDIDGLYSPSAKYWRLLVNCRLPEGHPWRSNVLGFYRSCDVVADSAEEALAILIDFEQEDFKEHLFIQEAEALEDCPQSPKGLYKRTGRCFYGNDDGEETA